MKSTNPKPAKIPKNDMACTFFHPKSSFTFHIEQGKPCMQLLDPTATLEKYTIHSPQFQQESKISQDLLAAELLCKISDSQMPVTIKRKTR